MIAIISLLSSIVVANVQGAKIAAEDVKRINDLRQIRVAIELYYNDNGRYPGGFPNPGYPNGATIRNRPWPCIAGINGCEFQTALDSYIAELPRDPWADPDGVYGYYFYKSSSDRQMYGLMAHLRSGRNVNLMANDGGASSYSDMYEIGTLPAYCAQKYNGFDEEWFSSSASGLSCRGGN